MDRKLLLVIFLSLLFIVGAYLYQGFYYFFYGVVSAAGIVVLSLTLSFFIKKDTKYYDRNSDGTN